MSAELHVKAHGLAVPDAQHAVSATGPHRVGHRNQRVHRTLVAFELMQQNSALAQPISSEALHAKELLTLASQARIRPELKPPHTMFPTHSNVHT